MTRQASFSLKNILTKTTLNLSLAALSVSSTLLPAFAGDPFRTSQPRAISSQTELAFNTIFKEGDYPVAKQYLEQAYQTDTSDPLVPALMASLAYTNQNWDQLNEYAQEVKRRATRLMDSDKLRGNLYLGVGHFMEGGYLFETKGTIAALGKVPTAISYLDKAKQEDTNDPEYNLIRGYADLLLATNLPFANVQQAIDRFEQHGAPEYLVQRGIAIAHRDLNNMPQALSYVNLALSGTNNNPELHYLKAQILYMRGNRQDDVSEKIASYAEARTHFDIAYERRSQLPAATAKQLENEYKKFSRSFEQYNQ